MALVLAGEETDTACKKRCFDYYEAVTTHDSTLSAPIHSILAAEVGHADKALAYFLDSLRVDRMDRRGRRLRVEATPQGVVYRLESGAPLRIHHDGVAATLRAEEDAIRPLAQPAIAARAAFPRRCEALIFDLDGVLTDTANTHYRAWKRMADEIGVPFDLVDNERLKGVDRMTSLDLILERAPRAYAIKERAALAAHKNDYYVDGIREMTPDSLFDGVRALLAEARARGLKLGLASASRNAALLLQRLGIADGFDHVVDAARLTRAKPDPEIFLAAASALGVSPAACIGIEDSLAGIAAIHAAGMSAIGVGDAGALPRADAVIAHISQLRLGDFVLP